MSFKLVTPKNTRNFKEVVRGTSIATTKGALYTLSLTTGNLGVAGASTAATQEIYLASRTLTAGTTPVHALIVERGDEFLADTVNNTAATHKGQRCVLDATGLLINNTGTDAPAGPFEIVDIVGVAADKKVLVKRV